LKSLILNFSLNLVLNIIWLLKIAHTLHHNLWLCIINNHGVISHWRSFFTWLLLNLFCNSSSIWVWGPFITSFSLKLIVIELDHMLGQGHLSICILNPKMRHRNLRGHKFLWRLRVNLVSLFTHFTSAFDKWLVLLLWFGNRAAFTICYIFTFRNLTLRSWSWFWSWSWSWSWSWFGHLGILFGLIVVLNCGVLHIEHEAEDWSLTNYRFELNLSSVVLKDLLADKEPDTVVVKVSIFSKLRHLEIIFYFVVDVWKVKSIERFLEVIVILLADAPSEVFNLEVNLLLVSIIP